MSIHDAVRKIKRVGASGPFVLGVIIALVASASFALGRISAYQGQKQPIQIEHIEPK